MFICIFSVCCFGLPLKSYIGVAQATKEHSTMDYSTKYQEISSKEITESEQGSDGPVMLFPVC